MSEVMTAGRAVDTERGVMVMTVRPDLPNLSDDVRVLWSDRRSITPEQRRKAWALMGEIAAFQGETKEQVHAEQKTAFTLRHLEILQGELFSLSTATVSTARAYITMLIDIIIEYGIPTREPLVELCDDIDKYLYTCTVTRTCAVCGRKGADIHHCEGSTVGMGGNRRTMIHLGLELMPLCRTHHDECHRTGQRRFNEKYHIHGVTADENICKKVGLKYAE